MPRYDLVIIGAGSAGLTAAEFAARIGVRTALVEQSRLGGDCLWTGCVPSKSLLATARRAHQMRTAHHLGLVSVEPDIDLDAVWKRIADVQEHIAVHDSETRLSELGIDVHFGAATVIAPDLVRVGTTDLSTRFILLATGSRPVIPAIAGIDEIDVLTTDSMWASPPPRSRLAVIGGGAVGMEIAQALNRLGVRVTLFEALDACLSGADDEHARTLTDLIAGEGVDVRTSSTIERVERAGDQVTLHLSGSRDGRAEASIGVDDVLVAVGRRANADGLGLEAVGVDGGDHVVVDDRLRTSVPTIFAAGDVAGRHQLTHAAAYEASLAVRNMFFPLSMRAKATIPWTTFTDPEFAGTGLTESQARARRRRVAVHRPATPDLDRALADVEPFDVKIITSRGRIVGASVLGPAAGELINELTLAIDHGLRLEQLGAVVHAYPTYGTALHAMGGFAQFERAKRLRRLVRRRT